MLRVGRKRPSLVAAAGQHHRGPECLERFEMRWPVVDGAVEDGPDQSIVAHLGVKGFDDGAERAAYCSRKVLADERLFDDCGAGGGGAGAQGASGVAGG